MSRDKLLADPHAEACLRELISQISALRQAAAESRPAVLSSIYPEEFVVSDDL
jgi:hypothetical protein